MVAQQFNPDYLVLLNQDTAVDSQWLKELVKAGEGDPKIGIAQSLLLLHPSPQSSPTRSAAVYLPQEKSGGQAPALQDGKNDSENMILINSLGNAIHFLGFGYCLGYRKPATSYILHPASSSPDIPCASGAAMLVRNALYQKIGLFDDSFFMYHEDLDLCWRARLYGWRIVLAPKSRVYHKYEFSRSIKKYYFMERNRFITIFKNYHLITLIILSPFLLLMELGLLFQAFRMGWWREKLRVYGYFFNKKKWRDILKKRREIQGTRVISDCEAVRLFTGRIWYQEIHSPLLACVANPFFGSMWWMLKKIIWW